MKTQKLTMEQLQKEAIKAFRTYCEVPIGLPENLSDEDFAAGMDAITRAYLNAYVAGFALANK